MACCLLLLLATGCGSGNGTGTAGKFLDQKKEIAPGQEWNREVNSKKGGTFTYRVTSQGPFAITLITDKGLKAAQGGGKISKEDILQTADSPGPNYEGKATVSAGSSWFIIENRAGKKVEMHLECFAP
jgi:hypothetical protein